MQASSLLVHFLDPCFAASAGPMRRELKFRATLSGVGTDCHQDKLSACIGAI